MNELNLDKIYGYVELVETMRIENGALIMGGYGIHHDRTGKVEKITENVDNVRLFFK